MVGQFAAIGRQRAVATLLGLRFSGFIAWLLWRGAYLLMLPRLDRKIRVLLQWVLDICFARDTVQLLTVQSVRSGRLEELMDSARAAECVCEVKPQSPSENTISSSPRRHYPFRRNSDVSLTTR